VAGKAGMVLAVPLFGRLTISRRGLAIQSGGGSGTHARGSAQWQIFIYQKRIIRIYGHEGRALIRVFIALCVNKTGSKIRLEQDHLCLE